MTSRKQRVPMQVAPEFKARMEKIQTEIMKMQGKKISIRDLTETIAKASDFEYLNKLLFGTGITVNDLGLNFDRRRKK